MHVATIMEHGGAIAYIGNESKKNMNNVLRYWVVSMLSVAMTLTLSLCVSAQESVVSRRMLLELGNRTGFVYEQAVSDNILMRYSVGLSLNQVLNPSQESGMVLYPSNEHAVHGDLGTQVVEQKSSGSFHFVSQHYGISPFLSVGARWYPHPLVDNGGFYLQLAGEYIPNQWSLVKMGDYPSDISSVISFPFSAGYCFRLSEGWSLRIAGRLIGGALYNKPNKKWDKLLTTGIDFGVSYSF